MTRCKKLFFGVSLLTMLAVFSPFAVGKPLARQDRISLSVRNVPLQDVIRMVAEAEHLNVSVSDKVSGQVSMFIKNVKPQQVLNILKKEYGLTTEVVGNTLIVMPVNQLISEMNNEKTVLTTNWNLQNLKMSIIPPKSVAVIHLKYVKADKVADLVKKVFFTDKSMLTYNPVTVYKNNNDLIVKASPVLIDKIKEFISNIDRPKKRIAIEAEIVEVNSTYEKSLGIQWGGIYENRSGVSSSHTFVSITGGNLPSNPINSNLPTTDNFVVNLPASPTVAPIAGNIGLLIGRANYNAELRITAGELEGYTKIISTPKVVVNDGSKATISNGQEIPYQESAGASGATSVSFQNAALTLDVTPTIADNGNIIMRISVSKDSPDYTHSINGEPPINTESVTTTVTVKSGQTIVIGGLVQKTKEKEEAGVPVLKDIPLLGWLFKRTDIYKPEFKLYIFIKPVILQ